VPQQAAANRTERKPTRSERAAAVATPVNEADSVTF
jgi:hypothetical protein